MKKIVALLLTGVMALSLAACGSASSNGEAAPAEETEAAEDASQEDASAEAESSEDFNINPDSPLDMTGISGEGYRIAFMVGDHSAPWPLAVREGAVAAGEDYGCEVVPFDGPTEIDKYLEQLESFAAGDFDAVITFPIDGEAEKPVFMDMQAEGHPVITVAGYSDVVNGWVQLDQYGYGKTIATAAADWINENLDGKANIVIMSEDWLESSIARGDGIEETLNELCPDSTIVARQSSNGLEEAMDNAETLLTQRDDINCFVCCNDTFGMGAYQALVNAGYLGREDVGIFSGDFTDEVVGHIKEGDIYRCSVDIEPHWSGYTAVEMALYQLKNGLADETVIIPMNMTYKTQEELMAEG